MREDLEREACNPAVQLDNLGRHINFSGSALYRGPTVADLEALTVVDACNFYNACFRNLAEFTVVVGGNIEVRKASPWEKL